MRCALGYELESPGRQLERFVTYLGADGHDRERGRVGHATGRGGSVVLGRAAVGGAPVRPSPQTIDPACEVPPARLLPYRSQRAIPYPYTPKQIAALMRAAASLPLPLMAATYPTLLGLLAVSGMRIGEAIGLDRHDVDTRHGLLRVINSKFGKSREVPLDASAMRALDAYSHRRDQLCPRAATEAFLLSTAGTRLQQPHIHRVFSRLKRTVGLEPRSPRCRPRLHDLRHRFALATLIDWYREGVEVQARLLCQRRVSPNTLASYRDTFRLLLLFTQQKTGTPPARLELTDLNAPLIGAFLEHLETERGNTARTRNIRLAAIHSFFQYSALRHPEHAGLIQRVLAIPAKRYDRRIVTFLTPTEVNALLASPDRTTWAGLRDHALLLAAAQTGLRISELIGLTCGDVQLGTGAHLRAFGKGRKERIAPLTSQTVAVLHVWMRERRGQPTDPLFPSRDGGPLTRDAIERRLAKHIAAAQNNCPTLRAKRVTMHVLRHYVDGWVMWNST